MRSGTRWACGAAALTLAAWSGPALAWQAEVSWPTFFRAGPDRRYTVMGELDRGMLVDVQSCQDGWCRVESDRALGYAEQVDLSAPSAMPAKPATPPADADCIESRRIGSGYKLDETYRYCPEAGSTVKPGG